MTYYFFCSKCLLVIIFMLFPLIEGDTNNNVTETLIIGQNEGEEIYQIGGIAIDSLGNIFISDFMDYSVKQYNYKGRLQNRVGRRGRGPGEFYHPAYINILNDTVAILETQTPVIHLYRHDLEYIESIIFDNLVIDFEFNRAGYMLIAYFGKNYIYQFSGNKSVKLIDLEKQPDLNPLLDAFLFTIDKDDYIIVAYRFFNRIEIYSPKGEYISHFRLSSIPEKASINERGLPENVLIKGVTIDHKNRIAILIGGDSEEESRKVYIFSRSGDLLDSLTLPERSRLIRFDNYGNLYATALEGTVLKKYKIRGEDINRVKN